MVVFLQELVVCLHQTLLSSQNSQDSLLFDNGSTDSASFIDISRVAKNYNILNHLKEKFKIVRNSWSSNWWYYFNTLIGQWAYWWAGEECVIWRNNTFTIATFENYHMLPILLSIYSMFAMFLNANNKTCFYSYRTIKNNIAIVYL